MRIVDTTEVPVWDPLVRLFHWTLFISFCAAWFTEGELFEGLQDG
jgi:cytochrome b